MSFVADFKPSGLVTQIHDGVPRFGHSKSLAHLASSETADDYMDGIVAFCVFLSIFAFVWITFLLVLKFHFGYETVGWAAGGNVVDIKQQKKQQGLSKWERQERIIRNWRVQTACLLALISILPLSLLMLHFGLNPFIESLSYTQMINDEVDSRAFRAIQIVAQLQESHKQLNLLKTNSTFVSTMAMQELCPNFDPSRIIDNGVKDIDNSTNSSSSSFLNATTHDLNKVLGIDPTLIRSKVLTAFDHVNVFMKFDLESAAATMSQVTDITAMIDRGVDNVQTHDWIIKLGIVILDVVVIFLGIGVFFTKHSIDFPAYQRTTAWILLPIFGAALASAVVGTCAFVSFAIINADFCSGGSGDFVSPIGTMQEMLQVLGYNETTLASRALTYYGSDCLTDNPIKFLSDLEYNVSDAHSAITYLYSALNSDQLKRLQTVCGENNNIVMTNTTLFAVEKHMNNIRGTLQAAIDLTGCSSISPVLRRFLFGPTCTQSVQGLTWLWTTLLSITFVGLTVFTTRAAFFNPVIRGRRSKRREKEFDDYKVYMSKYYETEAWTLDWVPEVTDCIGKMAVVERSAEETDSTSHGNSPSHSEASNEYETVHAELIPAVVSSEDGISFLNLAVPVQNDTDSSEHDDDDSDYDSTYSYDSQDDMRSTSSSVFNKIFHIRSKLSHVEGQQPHDIPESNSSNSSMLGRLFTLRTPGSMRSRTHNHHSNLLQSYSMEQPDTIQKTPKSFLNNAFFHHEEGEDSDEDDVLLAENSISGVLAASTPSRYRYSSQGRPMLVHQLELRHYDSGSDSGMMEVEPLSPTQLIPVAAAVPSTPPPEYLKEWRNGRRTIGQITELS